MDQSLEKVNDFLRYCTIAFLATSVSIMITFLEVGKESIEKDTSYNYEIAILLFAISIPCMILDIFITDIAATDEKKKSVTTNLIIRIGSWGISAVGIAFAFNDLPSLLPISTGIVFMISFVIFFLFWLNHLGKKLRATSHEDNSK